MKKVKQWCNSDIWQSGCPSSTTP